MHLASPLHCMDYGMISRWLEIAKCQLQVENVYVTGGPRLLGTARSYNLQCFTYSAVTPACTIIGRPGPASVKVHLQSSSLHKRGGSGRSGWKLYPSELSHGFLCSKNISQTSFWKFYKFSQKLQMNLEISFLTGAVTAAASATSAPSSEALSMGDQAALAQDLCCLISWFSGHFRPWAVKSCPSQPASPF